MPVVSLTPDSADLPIGGVWVLAVTITDVDAVPVDVAPTVTVTLPGGSATSPTAELVTSGVWRALYTVATAGRYVARIVSTGNGAVDLAAYVTATVAGTGMPNVDDAKVYLDIDPGDTSRDDEIQTALDAESAAQRARCRVPAAYPADLREALLRRVARNLAMRMLPLAVLRGDGEAGDVMLPGKDPEVRRLEGPFRKVPIG